MQNIKFKVYDKFSKIVCEVLEIDFRSNKVTALFRNSLPNIYDFDEVEFLQFIGLKDINNKDIYEKDFLYNGNERYEVIYDTKRACFFGKSQKNIKDLNDLIVNGYYIDNPIKR